ncbi:type V CRISPR-associated protein Cas4 [Candidatus Falkowbacteria bacterium]|nr:type V CRISPR-associated protein Cas4 [Candidatus Falkowbacteria bacterium]
MFEDYIQISKLNDFLFCPYSIYLHNVYENFHTSTFHSNYQTSGKLAHTTIDNNTFSSRKQILQSTSIYSNKYKLVGKIDTFNQKTGELVERKNKIVKLYDGYFLQIYAQYFCLTEMGFSVKSLSFYSLTDNKKYKIELPDKNSTEKFADFINEMANYNIKDFTGVSALKCEKCIYSVLCPYSKC